MLKVPSVKREFNFDSGRRLEMAFQEGVIFLLLLACLANGSDTGYTDVEKGTILTGLDSGEKILETIASAGDPKSTKFFNTVGKMAGFLGATGGFVGVILSLVPSRDSAELAFMKKQFTHVNTKLDRITKDLEDLRGIIKFENQRSAYIGMAAKIHHGHRELTRFISQVNPRSCSDSTCKRLIHRRASRYVHALNVRLQVDAILHAAVGRTSAFGDAIVPLVAKTYKCNFLKVDKMTNSILKLAFIGQQVVMAHQKLTGSRVSMIESLNSWLHMVYKLRETRASVKDGCFRNLRHQLKVDINNPYYQIGLKTNDQANKKIKRFLELKYPWLSVVPYSYQAWGGKKHYTLNTYGRFWNMPDNKHSRKRNLVIGFADKKGTYNGQKYELMRRLDEIAKDTNFYYRDIIRRFSYHPILNKLILELKKRNVWHLVSSISVLSKSSSIKILSDSTEKYISRSYNFWYRFPRRNYVSSLRTHVVIVVKSREQAKNGGCSLTCNTKGSCKKLPLSSAKYCECKRYYQGDSCKDFTKIELAKTVDAMLKKTMSLPVLSDVVYDIKDLREYIGVGMGQVQSVISNLESSIERKFKELSREIGKKFEWANIIDNYRQTMYDLLYYAHRFEKLPVDYPDKEAFIRRGKTLASHVLHSDRIRKVLYQYHHMLLGDRSLPVIGHKSILLAFMELKAGTPCTLSYKKTVAAYWKQLLMYQQMGYMVWAQALEFSGQSTGIVNRYYTPRMNQQQQAIERGTCSLPSSNLMSAQCKGQYLLPSMRIPKKCKHGYYYTGSRTVTCKETRGYCRNCYCHHTRSATAQCENYTGKCRCKRNFVGKLCQYHYCLPSQFHCSRKKKCIRRQQRCDYENDCGDNQDEQGCVEKCRSKTTPANAAGGGPLIFLDRHRPDCGKSGLITSFRLRRSGVSRIYYSYRCCQLLAPVCVTERKVSRYSPATSQTGPFQLHLQSVYCKTDSFLSAFRLTRNSGRNKIRYEFKCCRVRGYRLKRRMKCTSKFTKWTDAGQPNKRTINFYLDRQRVSCGKRYFLNGFKLFGKSKMRLTGKILPPVEHIFQWRYRYRCCTITA